MLDMKVTATLWALGYRSRLTRLLGSSGSVRDRLQGGRQSSSSHTTISSIAGICSLHF